MSDVTIDYKDCKMTLLTSEQVFGKERLSFFKKHTNKCFATDFAIAMGCDAYEDEYVGKKKELYRSSPWYLSTRYVNPDTEESYWKLGNHYNYHRTEDFREVGIRPILQYNNIKYNKMYPIWKRSTIKLFEYPQDIVDEKTSEILEKKYNEKTLRKTNKTYTTDLISCDEVEFYPLRNDEYWYNGKKYVRAEVHNFCTFSNGCKAKYGDVAWFLVSPIEWHNDVKNKILFSLKIIASGVRVSDKTKYVFSFEDTEMFSFLNNHLIKEIVPSVYKKTPEDYIEDILSEIKKHREYYLGAIDIEGNVSILIKEYNTNVYMLSEKGANTLSIEHKDLNTLYEELVTNLNNILKEACRCREVIKPYYDMIELLEACSEDKPNPEFDEICSDINVIRTKSFKFITDEKIRDRLKRSLNGIIDKAMNNYKMEISKYKETLISRGKSFDDLKLEFRKLLQPFLIKLNDIIIKQDIVSGILDETKDMVDKQIKMDRIDRVKSLLDSINTAKLYIEENGNDNELVLLEKELDKIKNLDLEMDMDELIASICKVSINTYKIQIVVEERKQKKQKMSEHMVKTNLKSFFGSE